MESGSVWHVLGCRGGVFEEVWEGVGADGWAFWVCVGEVGGGFWNGWGVWGVMYTLES